eukprot:5763526-Amphidinium_carterae.1
MSSASVLLAFESCILKEARTRSIGKAPHLITHKYATKDTAVSIQQKRAGKTTDLALPALV